MSVVVDVARRARTTIRGTRQVPRLRLGNPAGPSTVWMVCPDWDRPAGGIRRQYRTGIGSDDVRRKAGFDPLDSLFERFSSVESHRRASEPGASTSSAEIRTE